VAGQSDRDEVMATLHLLLSRLYFGLAGRRALDPADIRLADDLGKWHRRHLNRRLSQFDVIANPGRWGRS
jgi:hypothetical protein